MAKSIIVVGIGPSGTAHMTQNAFSALQNSDWIYGSLRQLESVGVSEAKSRPYERLSELIESLKRHFDSGAVESIAILASGEPSFYGVAKTLVSHFGEENVEVLPGISSVQYLFSRVHKDMNDLYMTSAHGRTLNLERLRLLPKIAILTDSICGPAEIAKLFLDSGEDPEMIIGETLGYPEEAIFQGRASEVVKRPYEMNVVIVDRSTYDKPVG